MSQPIPNLTRADQMRKGQIRGRIRTGARTATKDQEREFLQRFERLAADPDRLVPRWQGSGADPFAGLRKRLRRVAGWKDNGFLLRWSGRGKRLHHAYAQTLRVRKAGRIVSFAHIKFRGREVNYVLRGRGLRDKLAALHNWDQDDVRLLGFLDAARRRNVVLVSVGEDLLAQPPKQGLPAEWVQRVLGRIGLDGRIVDGRVTCPHRVAGRPGIAYKIPDIQAHVELCRACVEKTEGEFEKRFEAHVLGPGGRLTMERDLQGSQWDVHPDAGRADFARLVAQASADALEKAKRFDGVTDLDLLQWADEALAARLDQRPEGFLLVGSDLWLGDYDAAAQRLGTEDLERRALAQAWTLWPPRVRASDATIGKLLEPEWEARAPTLLQRLSEGVLPPETLEELARLRPGEAIAELDRATTTEKRFAAYPRLTALTPPLRLAHDLFKAHRTANLPLFSRRMAEGVRDPSTRPLTLALARAFGQSASIEWQVPPHEKDQALFFEPYARTLARADPATYAQALADLAQALQVPAPQVAPA